MKKKILLIILIIAVLGLIITTIFIQKNKQIQDPGIGYIENDIFDDDIFCGSSLYSECEQDSDCKIGGCSSQLCGSQAAVDNMMSSCEFRPCYDHTRFDLNCGCKNNICQWY